MIAAACMIFFKFLYFCVFNTSGFFTIYEIPEITVRITAITNKTNPMIFNTVYAVPVNAADAIRTTTQ